MDLATRKYNFIQQIFDIDENLLDELELVLFHDLKSNNHLSISTINELDDRIESYKKNPDDVLDWDDVKQNW